MRDQRGRVSCAVAAANGLAMRIWSSSPTQQRKLAANTNSLPWECDLTINDVDRDLDESTGALAIYEESLNFRLRLAKIDPRNSQWQRDAAYFLDLIGDEYREVGVNQRAIAAYEESLAIWRQLAKIDWRNPERQLNILVSLNKLGDAKLDAGDEIGALAAYEESLIIRRHVSKDDPNKASRQLNVAESLEKIGDLKLVAGDIDGALAAYRELLSIDRELVTIDGNNNEWQRNLLRSLERFGDLTLTIGDTVAAVAAYEQTVALHRRLAASGKTNTQSRKEVSASLEKISRLKRWATYEGMRANESQLAEADKTNAKQRGIAAKVVAMELAAQEESLVISRQLAESDPSNTNYQFDVSTKLEGIANMKLRSGDAARALTIYGESLALRRSLAGANRASKKLQQAICNTLEKMGDIKHVTKDDASALVVYEESLGLRRRLVEASDQHRREMPGTLERLSDSRGDAGEGAARNFLQTNNDSIEWQRDVSASLEKVGDAKLNLGDNFGAFTAFEESLAIRRTLAERDKDNAQRQWDVLLSMEKVANTRLSSGDTHGGLAAVAEILAVTRHLLQADRDNSERRRGLSVTWDRLSSSTLDFRAALHKFSALSLPNLIIANRSWVRGLQRSLATLRKHSLPKLIAATRRLSQRYPRTGSAIMGKSSAQFKEWVRGLQCSAKLKGLTLKWLLLAPSSSHNAFSPPKQNEPIGPDSRCSPFQHKESTQGQSAILVPNGKENNANNVLTATASSAGPIDEPQDATSVEASMVTGGSADQSPVNTRSGKRRRRKRKRRGASHCLPASQKSDIDRARMN
jgi:tetratricopeptide (TPR) repeat protein